MLSVYARAQMPTATGQELGVALSRAIKRGDDRRTMRLFLKALGLLRDGK